MYDWENSETREGLYKGMAHGIENLAVDWVTGNVYWTDSDYKWIMVADKVLELRLLLSSVSLLGF